MARVKKQTSVAYSQEQMFALVNDIKAYPEFLPWCTATKVLDENDDSLKASVSISVGKIKQTFTTANTMQKFDSIRMRLVEGPFKELTGQWHFNQLTESECQVSLDMQFEFKNVLIKHALGTAFHKIIDSLVDAFVERARVVYGNC